VFLPQGTWACVVPSSCLPQAMQSYRAPGYSTTASSVLTMDYISTSVQELMQVSSLRLGEDHIRDYLVPTWGTDQQIGDNVEYMRALIRYMHATGQAPNGERLEVNQQGVVTSGNHRILAAWLLGWRSLRCWRVDCVAGWQVPLDEQFRKPLKKLFQLDTLLVHVSKGPTQHRRKPRQMVQTPSNLKRTCDSFACATRFTTAAQTIVLLGSQLNSACDAMHIG